MKTIIFYTLLCSILIGCSSSGSKIEPERLRHSATFPHSFENVWRAIQLAIQEYPIQVNNSDKGLIKTEVVSEGQIWSHPEIDYPPEEKYKITIRTIKGKLRGQPATKVKVVKSKMKIKNFFDGEKKLDSDGFEEAALLYRIKREVLIEHALEKMQKKQNSNEDSM